MNDAQSGNTEKLLEDAITMWFSPGADQTFSETSETVTVNAMWGEFFVEAWYAYLKAAGKVEEERAS